MPWIIPVVIPIIIGGESKDAKNINFINFTTEFHDDTEILDVYAPDDYYTITESDLKFASLLNPTFTGQVTMNSSGRNEKTLAVVGSLDVYGLFTVHGPGNIGLGTLEPTVAVDVVGTIIRLTGSTRIIGDLKTYGQILNNDIDIIELINSKSDSTASYTKAESNTLITNLVNSAPETLDTLKELATALGNDQTQQQLYQLQSEKSQFARCKY